jgi:hypothetical protein
MTASLKGRTSTRSPALAALAISAMATVACGVSYFEIPIETPIQPKLDVSSFQRVLIAGFVAGGTDEVDANQETVRLLRSQLRSRSSLRVIDADTMPLAEIARDQNRAVVPAEPGDGGGPSADGGVDGAPLPLPDEITNEKDIEAYERLFANTAYWRRIGEEYQDPLIVTGTVLFAPHSRAGVVQREVEQYDSFGRRRTNTVRNFSERRGFVLRPKFIFIDGRTGATIHSETFREEVLYSAQQSTPPLSSYFELMDRLLPSFLSALSSQKVSGTRILLQ